MIYYIPPQPQPTEVAQNRIPENILTAIAITHTLINHDLQSRSVLTNKGQVFWGQQSEPTCPQPTIDPSSPTPVPGSGSGPVPC